MAEIKVQKIIPFLWFDKEAEEAAKLYTSIFPNSKILSVSRYGKEGFEIHHMPEGTAMTVGFELNGQEFTALNGGPIYKFTEAVSFVVACETQEEVDYFWNKLSAVPEAEQCGWLKDKFGLSWQVIPKALGDLLSKDRSGNVMKAMLGMKKIVIKDLEAATV
jgi:predicted 3-demethylubiquinone-9 3-methyltransferase (glyoxalase superfamily)